MSHSVPTEKTNIPSSSALWAVLIFIGLILAAINFVKAENSGEGHGEATTEHVEGGAPAKEAEHATEATAPVTETTKPATEAMAPTEKDTTKAATEEAHH